MSHDVFFIPSVAYADEGGDLVYREQSSAGRSLHILMQDLSTHAGGARRQFLLACFRDTIAQYLAASPLLGAGAFLRERALAFDAMARAVDTRLDDFDGLGLFVALREAKAVCLLCTRGGSARIRWRGEFMPFSTPELDGVEEIPIETSRAQHDLFAQTLPESLALYRVDARPDGVTRQELLFGGSAQDLAESIDAIERSSGLLPARTNVERARNTVVMLVLDPVVPDARVVQTKARDEDAAVGPRRRTKRLVFAGATILIAGLAGLGYWRAALDDGARQAVDETVLKETPAPALQRRGELDTSAVEEAAATPEPAPAPQDKHGFGVAWQKTFRAAVTSSPTVAGDAVIFGVRDGKVYSMARSSGERQWAFAAHGGVGASPVYRNGVVIVADYGGNVAALRAGNGSVIWKRALGSKIVSTPAVTGERVAVGTSSGRVYALSLESGRVLWKFSTRGAIRGAITSAADVFLVPSYDGRVYALDEAGGSRRWMISLDGPVAASPATDGDIVVVGSPRGDVIAVDIRRGKRRWTFRADGAVNSGLVLDDGRVYAGAGDRRVYCIDAGNGALIWRFDTEGVVLSRPFVADGRVVITSYDGSIYCLDSSDGRLIDRYATGESIFSSPVVIEGRVFFGNNAGRFYGLETPQS